MIDKLGRSTWIHNWSLLHSLAHLNLAHEGNPYCFGNANAFHAVTLYQTAHLSREPGLEGQLAKANADGYLDRQKMAHLAQLRQAKNAEKRGEEAEVAEPVQVWEPVV